ncbi:MAG TPA: hypothetical protein VFL45_03835 [Gammaproteobacteria bacterium]|nr:hypothetical protein [Gammaproteobacteria bacterium]HET7587197.1 hypothetical protein [Gammaproteobacteria bacterium]
MAQDAGNGLRPYVGLQQLEERPKRCINAGARCGSYFPGREQQDVATAAYKDVFTAAREIAAAVGAGKVSNNGKNNTQ